MNLLARAALPFAIKSGDAINWASNRPGDEYAASPVDVIRSFLRQQDLVYRSRSRLTELFVVAEHDWISRSLVDNTASYFFYIGINVHIKLLDWRPAAFDPADFSTLTYDRQFIAYEDPEDDAQLHLLLDGTFSPSNELISLWLDCVRLFTRDSNLEQIGQTALAPSDLELRQEFIRTLQSTLGTVAQQLRYDQSEDHNITRHGRFTQRMGSELSEQFMVGVFEAPKFLTVLGEELSAAISTGASIEGAWGYIAQDNHGDMIFVLNPPKLLADASFVHATRVE